MLKTIVFKWWGGAHCDLQFAIDSDGLGYCWSGEGWEATSLITNPCVTPALRVLAALAQGIPPLMMIEYVEQEHPQSARPEPGGEKAQEPGVGKAFAGDPSVKPPTPFLEPPEE